MTARLPTPADANRHNPQNGAPQVNLDQIYPGIASTAQLLELINRGYSDNPHHALGFHAGQWFECSECDFWYFLGSSPPLAHTGPSFALEEFTEGNLTHSFHRIGGRFFCVLIAYHGRRSVTEAAQAIATHVVASSKAS